MKLEVVVVPVSDVDRAKAFYAGIGWWVDADARHVHRSGAGRRGTADMTSGEIAIDRGRTAAALVGDRARAGFAL